MLIRSNGLTLVLLLCSLPFTVMEPAVAQSVEDIIEAQKEIKKEQKRVRGKGDHAPSNITDAGKKEFQHSCSLCHGDSAKGDGIYASSLVTKPADLTVLQKKNSGVFPFVKLFNVIDGREQILSHGPREMPVWGGRFAVENWLRVDAKHADTIVRGKIFELLSYLQSIQEKGVAN